MTNQGKELYEFGSLRLDRGKRLLVKLRGTLEFNQLLSSGKDRQNPYQVPPEATRHPHVIIATATVAFGLARVYQNHG